MRFSGIWHIFGWILLFFALALALPALIALIEGAGPVAAAFAPPLALCAFAGASLVLAFNERRGLTSLRQSLILLLICLLVLPLIGALPFTLSGTAETPLDAWFEAVSGLTTTGATVFSGLEEMPRAILFWRALLEWVGGFGAIVFIAAVLVPIFFPGLPVRLMPLPTTGREASRRRLERMAEIVWPLYVGLTLAGWAGLWAVGLPSFEALCLAMTGLATGGFLTRDGTLAAYGVPWAGPILAALMIAGSLSMMVHALAARGRVSLYWRDRETTLVLALCVGAALAFIIASQPRSLTDVAEGAFNGVSVALTSGMVLGAAEDWGTTPASAAGVPLALVVLVALIGGAVVSTSGGLRIVRLAIMMRLGTMELMRLSHPHRARATRLGGRTVDPRLSRAIWAIFYLTLGAMLTLTIALSATGLPFTSAFTAAIAALSGAGPILDNAGVSYASLNPFAKAAISLAMIAGRMELLALLAVLNAAYWRR